MKEKELKDNELEEVNGGMKVVVEDEESSWWETVMSFFSSRLKVN